jgi:hypothetical protein
MLINQTTSIDSCIGIGLSDYPIEVSVYGDYEGVSVYYYGNHHRLVKINMICDDKMKPNEHRFSENATLNEEGEFEEDVYTWNSCISNNYYISKSYPSLCESFLFF